VKCLVDNQLPPALARFLVQRGIQADHVGDLGLAEAGDSEIWDFVTKSGYVLISKDQDFLEFASKSTATKLVWVRIGNCRKRALLEAFEKLWLKIEQCFARGDEIIEVR
jgi:predicted nuclease of predicted toxin-antitoxin system